jgi:hypothetical protein
MADTTETADFDSTINILRQDLNRVDLALVIAMIDRWEDQLQGTNLFAALSELKQSLLSGNEIEIAKLLNSLGQETMTVAKSGEDLPTAVAAKIEEIGTLLLQAGNALKQS